MITCPKCSKDNQDHYKFCLGCGAELPRDGGRKPFAAPDTPAQGVRAAAPAPAVAQPVAPPLQPPPPAGGFGVATASHQQPALDLGAPPAAPAYVAPPAAYVAPPAAYVPPPAAASVATVPAPAAKPLAPSPFGPPSASSPAAAAVAAGCPQCGHVNSPGHVFCGGCGFRLAPAAAAKPAAPVAPPAPEPSPTTLTLTALRADGSEAGTFIVQGPSMTIGRETGGIFAGDSYLSPRHVTIHIVGAGRATVKDEASLNGVYKKVVRDTPVEVRPNEMFRIGQEIIRFEPLTAEAPSPDGVERLGAPARGYVGRIALVIGREETGNAFPIPETGIHLGRERGDILFPEDGYVSGLHCTLTWESGRLLLTDLGSSNGTFIRIREEFEVHQGDVLLMGQQLFRVSA